MKNIKIKIWSTSGQHVLPEFTLKETHRLGFGQKWHFTVILTRLMRDHVIDLVSFKNGLWCKNHLYFMKNTSVNIWSTFRQHLLPKCTFND